MRNLRVRTSMLSEAIVAIAATACLSAPVAGLAQPGQPTQLPQVLGKSTPSGSIDRPAPGPTVTAPAPNLAFAATVVTPVAVTLSWQPAGSVANYTLLRNGARVAQIAGNQSAYRDNTVKPQNSYSYQ